MLRTKTKLPQRTTKTGEGSRGGTYTPKAQQIRIKAFRLIGKSLREIARIEKKSVKTVQKIVKMPDMEQYVKDQREKLLALSDKALESMEFALENEENGQRASEFLERFGIYPAKQKAVPQLDATQILDSGEKAGDKEELAIQECMLRLVQTTMERHKVFGTKMTELDEMDVVDERHICKSIRHEP